MTDWPATGFSLLWILGVSVCLAAISAASYAGRGAPGGVRRALSSHGHTMALNAGMTLFCVGLMGTADALWERVVWGALALVFVAQAWTGRRGG